MTELTRQEIIKRHEECMWTCQVRNCHKPSEQIAHRITKGKQGRAYVKNYVFERYGLNLKKKQIDEIIHHRLNTVPTCRDHNDSVLIHISQTRRVNDLIDRILEFTDFLK